MWRPVRQGPLDTRQALLPVYARSGLIAFYQIVRDSKDCRWGLGVV